MPIVDITSPGGAFSPSAVGNTQEVTTTWTIGSGSTSLTCNGASPFVSGDTGKTFLLQGAGTAGGYLVGTLTFISANQVTVSVAAGTALSATSAYFAWGTDDSAAFQACNVWAQAQTSAITVTLGTGSHVFLLTDSDFPRINSIAYNVKQPLHVLGNGSSSTKLVGTNITLGTLLAFAVGDGVAKLTNRVNAGDTQAICKTPSDASGFTVGNWLMLSGLNLQNSGAPPNLQYFEFVQVTGVNSTTGVVSFATPALNTYLDTWPVFSDTDNGGPAAIYAMNSTWFMDVTYEGIGLNNVSGQTYAKGYSAKFIDFKVFDGSGFTPSQGFFNSFTNCDLSSYLMEYDKCIYKTVFDGTVTGQIFNQSVNNQIVIQNGCTISSLNGCARFTEIHDSTINGGLGLGANGFGRCESFISTNSIINGTYAQRGVIDANLAAYSMSGGIITIPKSSLTYGDQWQIPGAYCYFSGNTGSPDFIPVPWGPMFKILSLTDDATNVYVMTNWGGGGFPSWASSISNVPEDIVNFDVHTTGSDPNIANFVSATAAGYTRPQTRSGTWNLNGGNLGGPSTGQPITLPPVAGKLVSWIVDVTTPYTGTHSTLSWIQQADRSPFLGAAPTFTPTLYAPHIDLRTVGKRIITSSSVTSFGADSGLALPDANGWLPSFFDLFCASSDISAEYAGNPSVGPVFTTTIITDQGVDPVLPAAVVPLRMRLHS